METGFHLVQQSSTGAVNAIRLREGDNFIGRLLKSDVCNLDKSVSRQHARIEVSSGKVTIHDLNSTNGTFINNQQVQTAFLIPSQEVRFGEMRYRLTSSHSDVGYDSGDVETMGLEPASAERALRHPLVAKLSKTEKIVYAELLTGKKEQDIANSLNRSKNTIHNHAKRIYQVFGVHSRAELVSQALSDE